MNQMTYCAFCGHEEPIDGDGSKIAEHIRTCDKHPMRKAEERIEELEEEVCRLKAMYLAACQRVAGQSELLSKRAEK